MSKIKLPSKPPKIDMTPMVDLFMLLLTFFMLTTSFRPQEAVQVDTPNSIGEKLAPDKNVMTLLVGKNNRVYFNIDNGVDSASHVRIKLLKDVGDYYKIPFTKEQLKKFGNSASFGMPIKNIAKWIDSTDPKEKEALQTGIPTDSVAGGSELSIWIDEARLENPYADVAIKGDFNADYTTVKKLLDVLQDKKVNKFDLTTNLEKVEVKKIK
jgi:biopolymer transport protein ExbD